MFERVEQRRYSKLRLQQLLDDAHQDVQYALRQLRRSPAFAALVIATLAIGIGANATMVGLIDRLLFRPPPAISNPDRLTRFLYTSKTAAGGSLVGTSSDYATLLDFEQNIAGLEYVAGFLPMDGLPLVSDDPAAEVNATLVSGNFFLTFGVKPALGGFFNARSGFPTTATSGGPPLAVISYAFWQREFGGSTAVIGRSIQIGKLSYSIVGVAEAGFRGIESTSRDVWLPLTVALEVERPEMNIAWRGALSYLQIVGRLRNGVSRETIGLQASALVLPYRQKAGSFDNNPRMIAAPIVRGRGPDAPREVKISLWLGGVSALVLLIVCANVANLLLGRAFTRRREIAVRLALGAGRGRLARQLLTEALLLSVIGGAAGLYLAAVGGRVLQQWLATDITGGAFINLRLLGFTVVVALGTGVLVSLVPMLQSTSPNLSNGLRASSDVGSTRGVSVRTILLSAQAALCMVLLIGAALFAESLRRVQALDLGVDLEHTLQATLYGADALPLSNAATLAVLEDIRDRVDVLPGVTSVALAQGAFSGGRAVNIHPPNGSYDELVPRGTTSQVPFEVGVDSNMFRTIGTKSLRGRDFAFGDRKGTPLVTILNEPLARKMFPDRDAIGECVVLPVRANDVGGECVRVVGVLKGFNRQGILTRDAMVAYIPLAQKRDMTPRLILYVRSSGPAGQMAELVRNSILQTRPDLRRVSVRTMREVIDPEMRPWNLAAGMFVLFGFVALLIAMIGLYAVVSFSIAQRTSEIAIRLALGARTHHVAGVVGGASMLSVLGGLMFGVLVAVVVRGWVGPLLFQTSPGDPALIGGVALLLVLVAIVAMLVPLRRALLMNPGDVLRAS